jgi:hypothetical protein
MDEQAVGNGRRKGPATVVNGTRVTVAFPFSKIALQEPTDDLRDLAVLVADIADAVADAIGGDAAAALRRRAVELRDRMAAVSGG